MVTTSTSSGNAPSQTPDPPRWAPFWTAIGIVTVLIAVTALLSALAPQRDPEAISALERVNLGPESSPQGIALAGYIAPTGWYWVDPENKQGLRSPDAAAELTIDLATAITNPQEWLQQEAASGASFAPIPTTPTTRGLHVFTLTEDLAVNSITERILVCAHEENTNCVSIFITRTDSNKWAQQIEELINSVELL